MQHRHKINAIYKTNKCPEFYPCTDGTFSDKTGKGACSSHGGMLIIGKEKPKKKKTPAKKTPAKKPDHKPKPKKQIFPQSLEAFRKPKSELKLKIGNVFWAKKPAPKVVYNPATKYFAYSGNMEFAMSINEKNRLETEIRTEIKELTDIKIEKTNLPVSYKRQIQNINYTLSDALRVSNFKWKKPKQSKIPFFEPIKLHKYFKNIPSQNESQVAMTGIHYFDGGIVMTDAHKLLKIEYPFNSYEQYNKKSKEIGLEGKIVNKAGNLIDENYPNFNAVIPDYQDSKPVNIVKLYNYLVLIQKLQAYNPDTSQIVFKLNNKPKGFSAKLMLELVSALCKINNSETAWNLHYKSEDNKPGYSVSSILFELNAETSNYIGYVKGLLMPYILLDDNPLGVPYGGGMDIDYNREFSCYYDFDDDNIKMGEEIINLQNPSINGMKKRNRITGIFKTNKNAKYPCKDGTFTDIAGKGACSSHGGMLTITTGNEALSRVYKLMANKKYESFVKQLGKLAKDKKVIAILSSGLLDGNIKDEKLKTKTYYIDVKKLIPTQNEIDVDKSLKFALGAKYQTTEDMLRGRIEIVAPVVILNDKYILDGHHRWSQAYALNKDAKLSVISLYGDIEPHEMLKAIQIAIVRDIGEVPVAQVKGVNMLTVSNSQIADAVYKYISPKGLNLMVKYGKIKNPDKAEAVKYIIRNVESMRRTSQPIRGASSRGWMPQTNKAKNWLVNTVDGSNNYKYPFVKEPGINAIYKTNKCPEFYQCKDGTFTDKTGKGACSSHNGMLIISKEKPKKKKTVKAKQEEKDYFEFYTEIKTKSKPAAKLYNEMQEDFENWEGDTDKLAVWQEKFRQINWDFDIGMDGEAFDFRPIKATEIKPKVIQKSKETLKKDAEKFWADKVLKYKGNPIKIVYDKQTVDDYPYGRLRATVYYSTEFVKNKGMRTVFQSVNPKTGRVNKPKKSTYSDFYIMYRNLTNNYVQYFVFNLFGLEDCLKMLKVIKDLKVRLTKEQTDYLNFKILALFKAEMTATINYKFGGYHSTEEDRKYLKENGHMMYLWLSEVKYTEEINKVFSRVDDMSWSGGGNTHQNTLLLLEYLPVLEKIESEKYKYETLEKAKRYFEPVKQKFKTILEKQWNTGKYAMVKKKKAVKTSKKKPDPKKKHTDKWEYKWGTWIAVIQKHPRRNEYQWYIEDVDGDETYRWSNDIDIALETPEDAENDLFDVINDKIGHTPKHQINGIYGIGTADYNIKYNNYINSLK